jgi:hypothetical protein
MALNTEHFEVSPLKKLVIVSDREKGLAKTVDELLPYSKHSHCCHQLILVVSCFGLLHMLEQRPNLIQRLIIYLKRAGLL